MAMELLPEDVTVARPLLLVIAIGVMLFGAVIAGMGIVLARFGAIAATKIHFFGQSFDSANVGIAAIFLGAATVVVVLTRLLKRLKELAALGR